MSRPAACGRVTPLSYCTALSDRRLLYSANSAPWGRQVGDIHVYTVGIACENIARAAQRQ
jgi:hypothetical protein